MRNLITATRPKTLLTGVAPIILAAGIAQFNQGFIDKILFSLTVICILLLQAGSNLVNDYYDGIRGIDNEDRKGPKRAIATGLIEPYQVKQAFIFVFLIAFIIGCYLSYSGGAYIFLTGLICIITAYCYTGGPLPLSYIGLGEFLAFIFFGPVAVLGSYYLQTQSINFLSIFLSLGPGLYSAALMSLNNYRDIEADSKTRKKTIAILIGKNKAKLLTIILLWPPLIVSLITAAYTGFYLIAIPLLITPLIIKTTKTLLKTKNMESLNPILAKISILNLLWCFLQSVSLVLVTYV